MNYDSIINIFIKRNGNNIYLNMNKIKNYMYNKNICLAILSSDNEKRYVYYVIIKLQFNIKSNTSKDNVH